MTGNDFDRGQAHTLEAVVAGLLLLSSLLFALQVTTVTPLSASTSSQHIENQQRAIGAGLLASAAEKDVLKPAVLYWNATGDRFHNSDGDPYSSEGPPNEFGSILETTLGDHGIAYDVDLVYNTTGGRRTRPMVDQGFPSDNAVTVSRTIVLTDDAVLYDENGTATATPISESNFYAADVSEDTILYNTVTVEVTIWRI